MKKYIAVLFSLLFALQTPVIKADNRAGVPDGYRLVEVVETNFNEMDKEDANYSVRIWSNWEIRNFRKDSYDIYYPESPVVSDYFDGPADYEQEFSGTGSATFNFSSGIAVDLVEAKVGFSSSYSQTFTRKYRVKASDGEIVNIKVFINYRQWRFDAYKNGEFQATEFVHKPIGLKFKQYRYKK